MIVLTATVSLTGCVGYRVGSMLPPGIQTVYVPTVVNKTDEPLVETTVTRELITRLQTDGSLRVVKQEEADAVLKVTLDRYTLSAIAYERNNEVRPNEYRVILSASYVMTNAKTGAVLSEQPNVEGEATFEVVGDMTSSKRTALPTAARDLSHDLVESIVETWPERAP